MIDATVLSVIITEKEQDAVTPSGLVAVYVIVVVPILNVAVPTLLMPVLGELPVVAPVITQVSFAVLLVEGSGTVMLALQAEVALPLTFPGQLIDGPEQSVILTVCDAVDELQLLLTV